MQNIIRNMAYNIITINSVGDKMNVNVKFTGVIEEILDAAIQAGLAKDRTEALRMSVLELEHHYHLLEKEADAKQDEEDVHAARVFLGKLKNGRAKLYSEKEVRRMLRS